jgi:hypothetical protein
MALIVIPKFAQLLAHSLQIRVNNSKLRVYISLALSAQVKPGAKSRHHRYQQPHYDFNDRRHGDSLIGFKDTQYCQKSLRKVSVSVLHC